MIRAWSCFLGGEPGIKSARYADEHGNYLKNNLLLLEKMENIKARKLISMICFFDEGETHYFEGRLNGECQEMKGENGFGYDPLFSKITERRWRNWNRNRKTPSPSFPRAEQL